MHYLETPRSSSTDIDGKMLCNGTKCNDIKTNLELDDYIENDGMWGDHQVDDVPVLDMYEPIDYFDLDHNDSEII